MTLAQVFVIKQQIKELAGYENCHSYKNVSCYGGHL